MIANQLMSDVVPALKLSDSCKTALNWMEVFKLSHIPVVQDEKLLGMISDNMIYDTNKFEEPVQELLHDFIVTYADCQQHIIEVIELIRQYKLTAIPITKDKSIYKGLITLPILIENIGKFLSTENSGGIIVLEVHVNDYSLTEISQIIESNEAKILSIFTTNIPESMRINITIKVNKVDLTSILRTFERYEYEIKASYSDEDLMEDTLKSRYDSFMKYLDM